MTLFRSRNLKCFRRLKALHMVMVMSTAGRRGKWKASRGSSMEQSTVHLYLSILLSSFLSPSFLTSGTNKDGNFCTSALFDCGLASRENESPIFQLTGDFHLHFSRLYYFFFNTASFCLFTYFSLALSYLESPVHVSSFPAFFVFTFCIVSLAWMAGRMIVQS